MITQQVHTFHTLSRRSATVQSTALKTLAGAAYVISRPAAISNVLTSDLNLMPPGLYTKALTKASMEKDVTFAIIKMKRKKAVLEQ